MEMFKKPPIVDQGPNSELQLNILSWNIKNLMNEFEYDECIEQSKIRLRNIYNYLFNNIKNNWDIALLQEVPDIFVKSMINSNVINDNGIINKNNYTIVYHKYTNTQNSFGTSQPNQYLVTIFKNRCNNCTYIPSTFNLLSDSLLLSRGTTPLYRFLIVSFVINNTIYYVMNVHLYGIPKDEMFKTYNESLEKHGESKEILKQHPHFILMKELLSVIEDIKGTIFVGGDFNQNTTDLFKYYTQKLYDPEHRNATSFSNTNEGVKSGEGPLDNIFVRPYEDIVINIKTTRVEPDKLTPKNLNIKECSDYLTNMSDHIPIISKITLTLPSPRPRIMLKKQKKKSIGERIKDCNNNLIEIQKNQKTLLNKLAYGFRSEDDPKKQEDLKEQYDNTLIECKNLKLEQMKTQLNTQLMSINDKKLKSQLKKQMNNIQKLENLIQFQEEIKRQLIKQQLEQQRKRKRDDNGNDPKLQRKGSTGGHRYWQKKCMKYVRKIQKLKREIDI